MWPIPHSLLQGQSHQNLLSGLWESESQEAASNQGGCSQEDGDHLGHPNKGSKNGVSQDGAKLAESIEEAEGGGSGRKGSE